MGVIVRQKVSGKGQPWWVFITHNGKRTSRQVGDKPAAEKVASDIRARLKLNLFDFEDKKKPSIPLFKDFAEGFMQTFMASDHKESTRESYQSIIDRHLNPHFGEMPIDRIAKRDVKDFLAEKMQTDLKLNSLRNIKRCFSSIMSEAVDDEIIPDNPVFKAGKMLKKNQDEIEEVNSFTWEEKNLFEETILKHYPRYTLQAGVMT